MDLRDPRTFERAYREHFPRAYAAARRVLDDADRAADAAQDAFLRLWRHPDRFDESRGEIGAYLALMARSRAIDIWRAEHARGRATDRLAVLEGGDAASGHDEPAEAAVRTADRAAVLAAVRSLPAAQREAVALAYWGELSPREISERSGVPFGTVRSRIRLGLEKLGDAAGDLAA
jgi:RNA polymerase sigma-70 factor (ECF subfamily)